MTELDQPEITEPGPASPIAEQVGLGAGAVPSTPAAGEHPDRRSGPASLVAGTYAILIAGLILMGAALLSGETARNGGLTALGGAIVITLGAGLLTEIVSPRLGGSIGLVGGLVLGISAFAPEAIQGPEVGRLLAAAMLLLASAGILAGTIARRDHGERA